MAITVCLDLKAEHNSLKSFFTRLFPLPDYDDDVVFTSDLSAADLIVADVPQNVERHLEMTDKAVIQLLWRAGMEAQRHLLEPHGGRFAIFDLETLESEGDGELIGNVIAFIRRLIEVKARKAAEGTSVTTVK